MLDKNDWTIEVLFYEEDELCHFEEFHLFETEVNAEVAFWRLKDEAERDIFASRYGNPYELISLYKGKSPEGKASRSAIIEKKEEKKKEKISRLEDEICWLKSLLFRLQEERSKKSEEYYAVIVEGGESPEDYYRNEIVFPSLEKANNFFDYKVAEAETATGLDKEFVAKVMWIYDTYKDEHGAIKADCSVFDENGRWIKDKKAIREYERKD